LALCGDFRWTSTVAFSFITRNYLHHAKIGLISNDGIYGEQVGVGWIPSWKVRLFRNDKNLRFENPVHELVEPSLEKFNVKILKCDIPVHHYGMLDQEETAVKGEGYYYLGKEKLKQKDGKDIVALYELARQAAKLGQYEEALKYWTGLTLLDQNSSLAFYGKGTAHFALGRYQEALSSFRKVLQLDPVSKDAIIMISTCEILIGKAEESLPRLEALQRNDPLHQMALFTLAVACFCTDRKDKGMECVRQLKKLHFNADYYFNFARLLIVTKRVDYAIALLEAISEVDAIPIKDRDLLSLCYKMRQLSDSQL